MLQRLTGGIAQVSNTKCGEHCLTRGAHSAVLLSSAVEEVAIPGSRRIVCWSFGVAHVPSESCLVFPPGHPQRHF